MSKHPSESPELVHSLDAGAVMSRDCKYRYHPRRRSRHSQLARKATFADCVAPRRLVILVMLNPSTADTTHDAPTVNVWGAPGDSGEKAAKPHTANGRQCVHRPVGRVALDEGPGVRPAHQ